MTNKKQARAATRARHLHAKKSQSCDSCGNWHCECEHQPIDDHDHELDVAAIKSQVIACANELGLTNEAQVKLIAEACVVANQIAEAQIKAIVEACVKTDADIKAVVLQCLLDQGPSGVTAEVVQQMIDDAIASIVFPDVLSADDAKVIALQCFIDNMVTDEHIKSLIEQCQPEPVDVKSVVLQCLLDNPQGLTEAQVELIFTQLIEGQIPTEEDIKAIFVQCLEDWDIAPQCIKDFVCKCVIELLPKPVTQADVKCFVEDCYGDQLHTEADILAIVNTALISAPKPRTDEEIKAIIDDCVTDDRIKVLVLQCINSLEGDRWTEAQIKALIQTCVKTDEELKLFIQACVDVPSTALIESLAKTVALQCFSEQDLPTDESIKAQILECLKELEFLESKVTDVDINGVCDPDGMLTLNVEVDGVTGSTSLNLSKFLEVGDSGITLEDVVNYISTQNYLNDSEIQNLIDSALNQAEAGGRFCINDLSASFDANTGQLTVSVTDSCGVKSASVFIPTDTGGVDGITAETAKAIAQQCIDEAGFTPRTDQEIIDLATTVATTLVNNADYTTFAEAKTAAQDCINDPVNDSRFCNQSVNTSLIGSVLTTSIVDSCGTVSDSVDLSALTTTPESYCISGITQQQNGSVVTLTFQQENCPAQQVSFTAATGDGSVECCNTNANLSLTGSTLTMSVDQSAGATVSDTVDLSSLTSAECCNTAAIGDVDVDAKTATITVSQTNGPDVAATLDLNPLLGSLLEFIPATASDGCTPIQSVIWCGQEIGQLPAVELKTDCKCITIPANFSGVVSTGIIETGTTQTIDWGDGSATSSGPSGTNLSHTYAASTSVRILTICNDNPCSDNVYQIDKTGLPAGYSCSCCDC